MDLIKNIFLRGGNLRLLVTFLSLLPLRFFEIVVLDASRVIVLVQRGRGIYLNSAWIMPVCK